MQTSSGLLDQNQQPYTDESASLTVLDCGLVAIGPNFNIITGEHETRIEAQKAHKGLQFTRQVLISEDRWIRANVTTLARVTIGHESSIGAGSVMKRNIPALSVAVGSPDRVVQIGMKFHSFWLCYHVKFGSS
jgi:serine acetyltransferase